MMTTSRDEGERQRTVGTTIDPSLDAVLKAAIATSTWAPRPVDEEPSYVLIRWRLIALQGSLRLLGYNLTNREGRLSSGVVDLDVCTRQARTLSGRLYVLTGPPGWDADGEWVLERWLQRQGVSSEEVRDLTPQLDVLLSRAAP